MVNWNAQQWDAISVTDCNLIVSASAGTGKTAVLVERLIRLICREQNPVSVDRLLVVTFTEAAATEMREKIARALREKVAEAPEDKRMRSQLLLLEKASISTIHSFCLSLFRRFAQYIGKDPDLAVVDAKEATLLRADTVDLLLERCFRGQFLDERQEEVFFDWLKTLGGVNPGEQLRNHLLSLFQFISSLDKPGEWIKKARKLYPMDGLGQAIPFANDEGPWMEGLKRRFEDTLGKMEKELPGLKKVIYQGLDPQINWFESVLPLFADCRSLFEQGNWQGLFDYGQNMTVPRRPGNKTESPEAIEAKAATETVKKNLDKLKTQMVSFQLEVRARTHAEATPRVQLLLDLLEKFMEEYSQAKRLRRVLDFADQEQFALELLQDQPDGTPSPAREWCRQHYDYVLVDEYQDVNPAQEAIFRSVSRDAAEKGNLFCVGDVKQSIYAFRQAAPWIFIHRLKESELIKSGQPSPSQGLVPLQYNYRSRPEILDGVNRIFQAWMTAENCGIDYDEKATLKTEREFPAWDSAPKRVQLDVLSDETAETGEEQEEDPWVDQERNEKQASWVAARIQRILGCGPEGEKERLYVMDEATGLRPVQCGDIVILLRGAKGRGYLFSQALDALDIPNFTSRQESLTQFQEVQDILNLLRLLDNPLQDIPLAATLRSPLENWSLEELLEIRKAASRDVPFSQAFFNLKERENSALPDALHAKCRDFAQRLDRWRTEIRRSPLSETLETLYESTGYRQMALARPHGKLARLRLERLLDLARDFDRFQRQGLFRFLHFLDQLEAEAEAMEAPSLEGENLDVVRITTIHASKGLEFPVVFLACVDSDFTKNPHSSDFGFQEDGKTALKLIHLKSNTKYPSALMADIREEADRKNREEELRLLYVALTRAQEYLFLSGLCKKAEEKVAEATDAGCTDFQSRKSFLDWLMPVFTNHLPDQTSPFQLNILSPEERMERLSESRATENPESPPEESEEEDKRDWKKLEERLRWTYPHPGLSKQPSRITTRELRQRWEKETEEDPAVQAKFLPRPSVFQPPEKETSAEEGAGRGILLHRALQHIALKPGMDYGNISAQLDQMTEAGLFTEEERDSLDVSLLDAFFQSDLGRRLCATPPNRIWREIPFLYGISPEELGLEDLAAYDSSERVRAQGVVDLLFEEEPGRFILVDYKSDRIPPEAIPARLNKHQDQIRLYHKALEGALGQAPAECHIFFLHLGQAAEVRFTSA